MAVRMKWPVCALCLCLLLAAGGLRGENYAVFFAGGNNSDDNWEIYYDEILRHYKHVVDKWNFRPENVWVLFADGTNPYHDLTMWVSGNENSDWTYVLDKGSTVLEANIPNTREVLTGLQALGTGDLFYFWSYDHGYGDKGVSGVHDEEGFSGWNEWGDNDIDDDVFAGWVNPIGAGRHAYVLGQCYSGGVLEELQMHALPPGHLRFGCASATHQETAQSSEVYEGFNDAWCDGIEEENLTFTQNLYAFAYNDTDWADGEGPDAAYRENYQHPWMVGDNFFLPVSVWEGSGAGGSSTDWENAGNWSYTNDMGMSLRVEFQEPGQAVVDELLASGGYLTLDWDAVYVGDSAWVQIGPGASFVCQTADIGKGGPLLGPRFGYIRQTGGEAYFQYELVLGDLEYSTGRYTLSNGLVRVTGGVLVVGDGGEGLFEHFGGDVEVAGAGALYVGRERGSNGTYTLHAGHLTAPDVYVGGEGTGTFTHGTQAQHDVGGTLHIAYGVGSQGTYTSAGLLRAGSIEVGYEVQSQGTLTVIDGTVEADNLRVGCKAGAQGHVSASGVGGDLTVVAVTHKIEVGVPEGIGTFAVAHGAWVIADQIEVGNWGNGTFTQTGGTVTAGSETIGDFGGPMQAALYEHTGGRNEVANNLFLGGSGGPQAPGYAPYGRYVLGGGGRLQVGGSLFVGDGGMGEFEHQDGEATVDGSLFLGAGAGSGTYTMSASQTSGPALRVRGNSWIGGDGGVGTFYQYGGTHTVDGNMYLGTGLNTDGLYEVHPGAVLDVAGQLRIGPANPGTSTGTLRINEGTVIADELKFGSNATLDTYGSGGVLRVNTISDWDTQQQAMLNCSLQIGHSGGSGYGSFAVPDGAYLTILADLVVGYDALGMLNHVGDGRHIEAATLYVGYEAGSDGTYMLASDGGSLSAVDEYVGNFGRGWFSHVSGTNTVTGALVLGHGFLPGRYQMNGGELEAPIVQVGGMGKGKFTQLHGQVQISGMLCLGGEIASADGTYELRNGTLEVPTIIVGSQESGAPGTLDWTDGTLSVETIYLHAGQVSVGRSWTYDGDLFVHGGTLEMNGHDLTLGTSDETRRLEVHHGGRVSAETLTLGRDNMGMARQTGGTVELGSLCLGEQEGAWGSYEMSGGSLSAGPVHVGSRGWGEVRQDGGTVQTNGAVSLGHYADGEGWYDLTGTGRLEAWNLYVGQSGGGTFTQNSPSTLVKVADELVLGMEAGGPGGSYELVNGRLEAKDIHVGEGSYGELTVWSLEGVRAETLTIHDNGVVRVMAGRLVAGVLSKDAEGLLSEEGNLGVMGTVGFNRLVGFGSDPSFAGNVEIGHAVGGAYAVDYTVSSGQSLSVGQELSIGIDAATTFTQSGADSQVAAESVHVGTSFSGVGQYVLQDGYVWAQELAVGSTGRGSMAQTGGQVTVEGLSVGYHITGAGTYELGGGALEAMIETIGHNGRGQFIQNGGTHNVWDSMFLGASNTADGTYTMNDGVFSTGMLFIGGFGTGRFHHQGGSAEVTGELYVGAGGALGELKLDRASLSVSGAVHMQPVIDSVSGRASLRYGIHGTTLDEGYGQVRNDSLPGEGYVEAGGTLVMDFTDYTPAAGDAFALIAGFGEVWGGFDTVTLLGLAPSGFAYDLSTEGGAVTFTALSDAVASASAVTSDILLNPQTFFGGNSECAGGMDVKFQMAPGARVRCSYYREPLAALGSVPPIAGAFEPAGDDEAQIWEVQCDGGYSGPIELTFAYDQAFLAANEDERLLGVWHHDGSEWRQLEVLRRDADTDRLTVLADSLSPFILGVMPLPGDCDFDGDVDYLDYLTLKRNLGTLTGAEPEDGDFDGDGDVDGRDFLLLEGYFGFRTGAPLAGHGDLAPEPGTLALLAFGTALLLRRRNRRTARAPWVTP